MQSKEVLMQMKEAVIRLKKQKTKQTYQTDRRNFRSSQSTIWYLLKKKEWTGKLGNTKRPGRSWKTTKVDDCRILI